MPEFMPSAPVGENWCTASPASQHAAFAIALGDHAAPAPDVDVDPFDVDVAAERAPQIAFAVDAVRRHVVVGLVDHQPPEPRPDR